MLEERKKAASLLDLVQIRGVEARNRVVISPMCQYSAVDGMASDWHLVQLGRFGMGGAGIVFVEVCAVSRDGRVSNGDLGLWSDGHVAPLARIAAFLRSVGAVPAIQIGHAGRKGNTQMPWNGYGPLDPERLDEGETISQTVAPSALSPGEGWMVPSELGLSDLREMRLQWRRAAERAVSAGFEIVEIHAAHGYLLHQFVSPISNQRSDTYGGPIANRIRFPLEIVEEVRSVIPETMPLFVRISFNDGGEDGSTTDEMLHMCTRLKELGVDVVDASSGGIVAGSATNNAAPPRLGYQVEHSRRIREQVGIRTMTVGLIVDAAQAEEIIAQGSADFVAIGREAFVEPNWALKAEFSLRGANYENWPRQFSWWLENRSRRFARIGIGDRI